jgi:hypothetical protein
MKMPNDEGQMPLDDPHPRHACVNLCPYKIKGDAVRVQSSNAPAGAPPAVGVRLGVASSRMAGPKHHCLAISICFLFQGDRFELDQKPGLPIG